MRTIRRAGLWAAGSEMHEEVRQELSVFAAIMNRGRSSDDGKRMGSDASCRQ